MAVVGAGELDDESRPVAARATRRALMTASVPDEVNRSRSIDGIARRIASPSSISSGFVAPRANPFARGGRDRLDHGRMGVPEDRRPPGADVVEVAPPVGIPDVRPLAALEDERRPADGAERPDGAVDAAREEAARRVRRATRSASRRRVSAITPRPAGRGSRPSDGGSRAGSGCR